ncbi:MAG: hypothetical protein K6B72_02325 [Lachnospiraceae bacterium]|nr:hypothetical protein [Lachnospiraceae bacterium]
MNEQIVSEKELTFHGYRFLIPEDVTAARTDSMRIDQLNRYLKSSKGKDILALYEKSIQNHIFSTPVGWEYLQDLRGMLIDEGTDPEKIPDIPISVPVTRQRMFPDHAVKERIAETPREGMGLSLKTSIIINLLLAALVIFMFFVANTSKTDNILNYRRNVTNEYSSWSEALTKREQRIRQKERELGISPNELTDESNTEDMQAGNGGND